jgi:hypothetical protein
VDARAKTLPGPSTASEVEPPIELDVESPAVDRGPSRRRMALIGALAIALAMGVALLLLRGPQAPVSGALAPSHGASAAPSAATADTQTRPGADPTTEPATITVSLRNLPKTALVFVDGVPASGDTLELPRDGRNRAIKVTAPGKVSWQAVHHASANASYDVALVDGERPASSVGNKRSTDMTRAPSAPPHKTHKSPPSALRKLDF